MSAEEDDRAASVESVAAKIRAMAPGTELRSDEDGFSIQSPFREIGEHVFLRLSLAGERADQSVVWGLSIVNGDSTTPVSNARQMSEAVTSYVWVDKMLRTRFGELQHLLKAGVVPRCVNNCGDLHNFVDWNMAGDAEELIEAGEQIAAPGDASPMEWACTILNAVDRTIDWWLRRHAEPSLAVDATAQQLAGLLYSNNPTIEQQVAERFMQMNHDEARELLRHAAGRDGSDLTTKVKALVLAAAKANGHEG